MIKDKGLKREGEKILGLDDYMKELKESQKDASWLMVRHHQYSLHLQKKVEVNRKQSRLFLELFGKTIL